MAESKEKIKNRIIIWHIAITSACDSLHVACELFDRLKKPDWIAYPNPTTDPPSNRSLDVSYTSYKALVESAAIYSRQLFSSGNEGENIAANDSPEIQSLRKKILNNAENELAWQSGEFQKFYGEVRDKRNRFLAHYDGKFANFQNKGQGITSMASPGIHFSKADVDKFCQFVVALRNAVVLELRNFS